MRITRILHIAHRFGTSLRKRGFIAFTRIVAIAGIAIGCIALLVSMAVLDGFQESLEYNAVKFTSDIRIQSFNGETPVALPESVMQDEALHSIEFALQREGLIRARGKSEVEGVLFKGIDNNKEFIQRPKKQIAGSFAFTSDTAQQIIIGKKLSNTMDVGVGDTLVLTIMAFNPANPNLPNPFNIKCSVQGIFQTGMAQYDDLYVFIPRKTLNRMMGADDNTLTHYEIMVKPGHDIAATANRIQDLVPYPLFVQSVYDLHAGMFHWIELQKKPIPIVLSLISIVAVFNILTCLLISVLEKTRSIGILISLGMKRSSILSMFVWQGITIGLTGIIVGCVISFALCFIQQQFGIITLKAELYFVDTLPVSIQLWHYLLVGSLALFLSVISTFVPAYIASRTSPVKALRFQ